MSGEGDREPRIEWRLSCIECGVESDFKARGWRAYLRGEDADGGEAELGIYCPACFEREFGPDA